MSNVLLGAVIYVVARLVWWAYKHQQEHEEQAPNASRPIHSGGGK